MNVYLEVNNKCNNNCIGCDKLSSNTSKKEEFFKCLREAEEQGYSEVLLSGGEFTVYPHFFEVLNRIDNHFSKVCLMTNGRRLSEKKFVRKLLNYSFKKEFIIPLYGPNSKIHQFYTGVEKSFEETLKGIKNLQKMEEGVDIKIVYVLYKKNYLYLNDFLMFLRYQKLAKVRIANLLPTGRAASNYQELFIPLLEIKRVLERINDFLTYFREIEIEDFSFCLIDKSFIKNRNVFVRVSCGNYSFKNGLLASYPGVFLIDKGIDISDIKWLRRNHRYLKKISDSYFQRVTICKACSDKTDCPGIFKKYIDTVGRKQAEKEASLLVS